MELKITGLEQVGRALREAAPRTLAVSLATALDRAAGVVAAEVEARTPEGTEGLLKESIRVEVEVDSATRGGVAAIGFSSEKSERTGVPQDVIATWVEYGHRQVTHRPGKKEVGHVPPHPFMRPAAEVSADRAIQVFADTLAESLGQEE